MHRSDQSRRQDDPYAPVPAWRADAMERRLDRIERESGRRVTHVEDRINRLLQSRLDGLTDTLIFLVAFAAVLATVIAVVASHH
jgi:hypothetical protein